GIVTAGNGRGGNNRLAGVQGQSGKCLAADRIAGAVQLQRAARQGERGGGGQKIGGRGGGTAEVEHQGACADTQGAGHSIGHAGEGGGAGTNLAQAVDTANRVAMTADWLTTLIKGFAPRVSVLAPERVQLYAAEVSPNFNTLTVSGASRLTVTFAGRL